MKYYKEKLEDILYALFRIDGIAAPTLKENLINILWIIFIIGLWVIIAFITVIPPFKKNHEKMMLAEFGRQQLAEEDLQEVKELTRTGCFGHFEYTVEKTGRISLIEPSLKAEKIIEKAIGENVFTYQDEEENKIQLKNFLNRIEKARDEGLTEESAKFFIEEEGYKEPTKNRIKYDGYRMDSEEYDLYHNKDIETLGKASYHKNEFGKTLDFEIKIFDNGDMIEKELYRTILHEMIHTLNVEHIEGRGILNKYYNNIDWITDKDMEAINERCENNRQNIKDYLKKFRPVDY